MFEAQIENIKGDVLTLTGNETDYQVVSITGLNPPNAQINMSAVAGQDGAQFNSSKLNTRNIVITLRLNGAGPVVEANRQMLYKFFATKQKCKFYYRNTYRNVYISAYVETFECDLFQKGQTAQISLICPQPYFKDMTDVINDISKILGAFEFPFAFGSKGATNPDVPILSGTDNAIPFSTIDLNRIANVPNESESETGVNITINILEDGVTGINIVNIQTGDTFGLNYDFEEDDEIIINTNKGEKSVNLIRNAITTNLFTEIVKGSTFFQLELGDNFFSYTVSGNNVPGAVQILFTHNTVYRGV